MVEVRQLYKASVKVVDILLYSAADSLHALAPDLWSEISVRSPVAILEARELLAQ